jgi:hypothetical protein
MVALQSAAAPTGSLLMLPHHHQQHQQLQSPAAWRFSLPASPTTTNSTSSGSSDVQPQQQQWQQQQPAAAVQYELGSQMEDGLLEGMRQFEAGVDRAFGAFTQGMHMIDAAQASSEQVRCCCNFQEDTPA